MTSDAPYADAVGTLAVRCGGLLDVETGETLPDRVLLVRDARVEAVLGPDDGLPDGTPVVDLGGLTVLPGFIDTHSHLVGEVQTAGVPGTTTSGAQDAFLSVRNARVTLEAGFTTVRDLGTFRAFVDIALRDTIDAGQLEGPRMQCSGAFITVPWGGGDVVGLGHDITLPEDLRFGVVTTPDEVRERVRRLIIGGAGVIKLIGTGAVLTRGGVPGAPELSEAEMRAAVDEATRYDRFVAVHAHSSLGAQWAIRAGARSVEHGSMIDRETVRMLADTGTYLRLRPVRRRVGAGARQRDRLARGHDAQAARDHGHGRRGAALGDRGRRPDHLLDRQRRLPARPGGAPVRQLRPVRHGAARRDPVGDGGRGRVPGLGRRASGRCGRPVLRPRGRGRRSPRRHPASSSGRSVVMKGGRVAVDARA